ncbi:MAG: Uma2 family endonuclease [Catenulispora sp.]|nr:Uma2 family endonuclease [Catenulispora sp.]
MNSIMYASEPLTTKEFFALDVDEKLKVELIGGALAVSPSPRPWHGFVANRLRRFLSDALGRDYIVFADLDVIIDDENTPRPDLFVVSRATYDPDKVSRAADVLLAIEIMSTGSRVNDRLVKPGLYRDAGIPSWRVERSGERLLLVEMPINGEAETHHDSATLKVDGNDVRIDLAAMAAEVFGV